MMARHQDMSPIDIATCSCNRIQHVVTNVFARAGGVSDIFNWINK